MKLLKVVLVALILTGILSSLSCTSEAESPAPEREIVTVERGDITLDITSSGNLALAIKEDLAFDMSGTVEEILVEEGDMVKEGQVLARLDASEWEDQVTEKERNLLQAEINLKNAEVALERAEDAWLDTVYAGKQVKQLKKYLEVLLEDFPEDEAEIFATQQSLREAWDRFLAVASNSVEARAVEAKRMEVELAQARLEDAKEALEEISGLSPEIVAPFDGFITKVNVDAGDEVTKGMVILQLADPNKFEAELLVSEMDILQVKLGEKAWVQVDAMGDFNFPAKVTYIAPTATIRSGVVNYKVKVELESLKPVRQKQEAPSDEKIEEAIDKILRGEMPDGLKKAIKEGTITEEQANLMMTRIRQGIESGLITREQVKEMMKKRAQERAMSGGAIAPTLEDFQLREGLTVTVNIIVEEKEDVLMVPNRAIIHSTEGSYVEVLQGETTEKRPIETGISNWQYTEVVAGLSEGEQIVIPHQETSTTPSTPQPRPLPFLPRPRR